jgi:hypothetical protein
MSLSTLILLIVAGLVLALAVVVFLVLRAPEASKRRVLALFRRPPRPPKTPGKDHYYRPYWS